MLEQSHSRVNRADAHSNVVGRAGQDQKTSSFMNKPLHPTDGNNLLSVGEERLSKGFEKKPFSGHNIGIGTFPEQGAKGVLQLVNILSSTLFHQDKRNSISSPLSLAFSLAILERGAGGKTKKELTKLLTEAGSGTPIDNLLALAKEIGSSGILKMTNVLFISKLAVNLNHK